MVLEKIRKWWLDLLAVATITVLLTYLGVPLEYVVFAVVAYAGVLVVYNRVRVAAMRIISAKKAFAKDNRAFIGDLLVGLAVALGIFLVVVIIVGILMAQSYIAGQTVAEQINDTTTKTTLTSTWTQIFTLYGYFGTWSPIIFITIFGGIAITAIYMFVAGRGRKGGEEGAI